MLARLHVGWLSPPGARPELLARPQPGWPARTAGPAPVVTCAASSSTAAGRHDTPASPATTPPPPPTGVAAAAARRLPFDERCRQLAAFRQQHGHTLVPKRDSSGLGAWVARQRKAWKAGRLRPEQRRALAALGFCADARQEAWSARLAQLAAFHAEHGHYHVPCAAARGKAAAAAAAAAAGPQAAAARTGQAQQQGNAHAAEGWEQQRRGRRYPGLYQWLQKQRRQWRDGTLPDERRQQLEGLGVQLEETDPFHKRCRQLAAFRQQHGHTLVPAKDPSGLGAWVAWQRHAWKAGQLRPERQRALAALGFCANAHEEAWSARFAQLAAFHSEHGHCNVPRTAERREEAAAAEAAGPAAAAAARKGQRQQGAAAQQREGGRYPGLLSWLQRQRVQWGSGTLPDERRRRLEGLGVLFQVQRTAWEARYAELAAFRQEFGDADVPYQWPRNPALASWVEAQRRRALGTQGAPLTPSQRSRLLSCGFRFEVLRDEWERRHAQLLELQRQRGGQLTSAPLPAAGGLRGWAAGQRRQWQAGRLAPDRAAKLQALGLLHGTGSPWKQRLAALDGLIARLGFPAAYALLVLAPQTTGAAAMAAAAVEAAAASGSSAAADGSSGGGDEVGGSGEASAVTPAEAAGAVRWYRALPKRRRPLPPDMAAALAARGLSLGQG